MFCLELLFKDGVSTSEMLLVRRPSLLIGNTDKCHLTIDGTSSDFPEVFLGLHCGGKILVDVIRGAVRHQGSTIKREILDSGITLDFGEAEISIISLESSFAKRGTEDISQLTKRVISVASSIRASKFPAIAIKNDNVVLYSFSPEQVVKVGRSRDCDLRLDSTGILAEHGNIGWSDGKWWVEPLSKASEIYIDESRCEGRTFIRATKDSRFGKDCTLTVVESDADLKALFNHEGDVESENAYDRMYLKIGVNSSPTKLFRMGKDRPVTVGSDPSANIYISEASNRCLEVTLDSKSGLVINVVSDSDTILINGVPQNRGRQRISTSACRINIGSKNLLVIGDDSAIVSKGDVPKLQRIEGYKATSLLGLIGISILLILSLLLLLN